MVDHLIQPVVHKGRQYDQKPVLRYNIITVETQTILHLMHLADASLQSDLQCIQTIHFISMCSYNVKNPLLHLDFF